MKELYELIARCVINNVRFPGSSGTSYGVYDFFNGVISNMTTIKAIGKRLEQQRSKFTDSAFEDHDESPESKKLDFKIKVVKAILDHKKTRAEAAEKAQLTREENEKMAAQIEAILNEDNIERLREEAKKNRAALEEKLRELRG